MFVLFFDTETTGLPMKTVPLSHDSQPRVVQLGAILDDEHGNERARIDLVIHVPNVPDEVAKIHGISTEISHRIGVNEAPVMDIFCDLIDVADLIVGQNVTFDIKMITACVRRLSGRDDIDPFKGKQLFCTMEAAKPILRLPGKFGFKRPNLTEIHRHFFGEDFANAHSAIDDVLATRAVYYEIRKLMDGKR